MSELKQSNAWLELTKHYGEMKDIHMRELFKNDENRFDKFRIYDTQLSGDRRVGSGFPDA